MRWPILYRHLLGALSVAQGEQLLTWAPHLSYSRAHLT